MPVIQPGPIKRKCRLSHSSATRLARSYINAGLLSTTSAKSTHRGICMYMYYVLCVCMRFKCTATSSPEGMCYTADPYYIGVVVIIV